MSDYFHYDDSWTESQPVGPVDRSSIDSSVAVNSVSASAIFQGIQLDHLINVQDERDAKKDDPPPDPDREINPILLQGLARSTITAICAGDPKAIPGSGQTGDASAVFSQLQKNRREYKKQCVRDCLSTWLDKTDKNVVADCFSALKKNMRQEQYERAMRYREEALQRASMKRASIQAAKEEHLRKMAANNRPLTEEDLAAMGRYIQFLPEQLAHKTDLYVTGPSTSGKSWELSDGSFVKKEMKGSLWVWLDLSCK